MGNARKTKSKKRPKKVTKSNFKKYGYIIQWQGKENKKEKNQFRIVVNDSKAAGWRIAYLIVRERKVDWLEQHPCSFESFEPLSGRAILHVSKEKNPKTVESFMLDKPIILYKGIWHSVVCLGKEAHIKITENNQVNLIKRKLGYIL